MGLKPRDCADWVYRPALPLSWDSASRIHFQLVGGWQPRTSFPPSKPELCGSGQPEVKSTEGKTKNPKWSSQAIFQFLKQSRWRSRYKSRYKQVDLRLTLSLAGLGEWVKVWNKKAERQTEIFPLWNMFQAVATGTFAQPHQSLSFRLKTNDELFLVSKHQKKK